MSKIKAHHFHATCWCCFKSWVACGGHGARKRTSHIKHNFPAACADPESFVRGDPTLTTFFSRWWERGSKHHYMRPIIGPPAKHHLNGASLACRWWPNIECWLGSFEILKGTGPVCQEPLFFKILRGEKGGRALTNCCFAVLNSHYWCWDSHFMKEAIFFCMVGLPLFGKEGSGTPVFKILVRALGGGGGKEGVCPPVWIRPWSVSFLWVGMKKIFSVN